MSYKLINKLDKTHPKYTTHLEELVYALTEQVDSLRADRTMLSDGIEQLKQYIGDLESMQSEDLSMNVPDYEYDEESSMIVSLLKDTGYYNK